MAVVNGTRAEYHIRFDLTDPRQQEAHRLLTETVSPRRISEYLIDCLLARHDAETMVELALQKAGVQPKPEQAQPQPTQQPEPKQTRRGRPKGSKNKLIKMEPHTNSTTSIPKTQPALPRQEERQEVDEDMISSLQSFMAMS